MDVSLNLGDLKIECLCMHARKICIIDYEYGSYSYRGYDIANHFNEHAGFECDYSLYVLLDFILHSASGLSIHVICYVVLVLYLPTIGQVGLMFFILSAETNIDPLAYKCYNLYQVPKKGRTIPLF
jgi:hypothetical protein